MIRAPASPSSMEWIKPRPRPNTKSLAGENTPVRRRGRTEEAAAPAFLAAEFASYITGQLMIVDDGNSIREYKGPPDLYY